MHKIRKYVLLTFSSLIFMIYSQVSVADTFHLSQGTYALCTKAKCFPIPGKNNMALCHCSVEEGYSAGEKPGEKVKTTPDGQKLIKSRYYPVESYVKCSNNRPWAFCLDSPCIVDESDPTKAVCTCSIVRDKGDYVLPSDICDKTLCEKGLYSSATTSQLDDIEAFLSKPEQMSKVPGGQKKECK